MFDGIAIKPHTFDLHRTDIVISLDGGQPDGNSLCFGNDDKMVYHPYCDDFGPLNMSSTIHFVKLMNEKIAECAKQNISTLVYVIENGRRPLTNAVMLLGSYMILMQDKTPDQVAERFALIDGQLLEDFRDATRLPSDFGLSLLDCWSGLHRGKQLNWIARPSTPRSSFWGEIDLLQYDHYDDPLEADLVEVVPLKFIAFRGPTDLGGAKYVDNEAQWSRRFGPEHFAGVLEDLDVSDVVRLNAPEYDAGVFEAAGIRHHELFFEDCTVPPTAVVEAFFRIVDAAQGVVAVHCLAGLGRTGTLIALYMMRTHAFTAREAMGWLRIMRPGSVIGEQQHYLCTVERLCCEPQPAPGALRSVLARMCKFEKLLPILDKTMAGGAGSRFALDPLFLNRAASSPPGGTRDLLPADADLSAVDREREQAAQVAAAMGPQSVARIRAGRAAIGSSKFDN
jgi:cell division cycle 14